MSEQEVLICTNESCTALSQFSTPLESDRTCFTLRVADDNVYEAVKNFAISFNITQNQSTQDSLTVNVLDNDGELVWRNNALFMNKL